MSHGDCRGRVDDLRPQLNDFEVSDPTLVDVHYELAPPPTCALYLARTARRSKLAIARL